MFDLLIQNAQVLDGTGAPGFTADVAVKDGKIAAVGKLSGEAAETVDGTGLTLAPGLIDVHGHSDLFMALDPARASKLLQGVTTELCGQCGLGPAPVSEQNFPLYRKYLSQQGVPMYPDNQDFTSFSAYLERMEKTKAGIHLAYFIPHGTVRMAVMGFSPAAPDKPQLEQMTALVEDAMQAGALGLSTGLAYAPGRFAATDELAALTVPVGPIPRICAIRATSWSRAFRRRSTLRAAAAPVLTYRTTRPSVSRTLERSGKRPGCCTKLVFRLRTMCTPMRQAPPC